MWCAVVFVNVRSTDRSISIPTSDELLDLTQTQQLFKSNLFKLQITELLSNVTLPPPKLLRVDDLLHAIKSTIDTLPLTTVVLKSGHSICGVPVRLGGHNNDDNASAQSSSSSSSSKKASDGT